MNPLDKLKTELNERKIDAVLISSVPNIIYLTGYAGFSKIHREGFVIVTQKENYIISSPLHTEDVQKIVKGFEVITMQRRSYFSDVLEKLSKQYSVIGIEAGDLKVAEYVKVKKFFKVKPIYLSSLRTIKTEQEIENIKKACSISDKIFSYVLKNIRAGMSEKELAFEMDYQMKRTRADVAFETIVAFGKNTSIPHHIPGNTRLKKNDVILLDFGASWNNYVSDISRTFILGKANPSFKKMYDACLTAQQKSIEHLESLMHGETISAANVDKVARDYIIEQKFGNFPHALGHGFGLDVHEYPILSPLSKDKIESDVPFTLEPGIYIPNFGGVRIEDDFVIRNNKLGRFTKSPNQLIEL